MSERGVIIACVSVGGLVLGVFILALALKKPPGTPEPGGRIGVGRGERPHYTLEKLPKELTARAAEIRRLAAPCVHLKSVPADKDLSASASKFGGTPCLGRGREWPKSPKGQPLTFIGQLNFAEIGESLRAAGAAAPPEMPAKGLLMFFYDMEEFPWGGEPDDRKHWQVIWEPAVVPGAQLTAVPAQKDAPKPCRLVASVGVSLPSADDEVNAPKGLSDVQQERYSDLQEDLCAGAGHQILGHARTIQNDPRSTVASVASKGKPAGTVPAGALAQWRLLWQIDSDDAAGFMWGDSGTIYLMIRDEDLKKGNLGKLGLELQCY